MASAKTLTHTDFNFPGQTAAYHGKVRDVYTINNDIMVMVATDRISAFDVILPKGIPYKGQVLNQIAAYMLDATADIVPNWKIATPDPMVTVGYKCEGVRVEMIIRGSLAGSAWREYRDGARLLCGVPLPEGLRENERLPDGPIITPTTKAEEGHDLNISADEIVRQGLVSAEHYADMERYTQALYERGMLLISDANSDAFMAAAGCFTSADSPAKFRPETCSFPACFDRGSRLGFPIKQPFDTIYRQKFCFG